VLGDTEKKNIRFIDSHYKDLFQIKDGDSIVIEFADGRSEERQCTFLDEYHTKIGNYVFHICEFAERMEQNGATYHAAKMQEKELRTGVRRHERTR
jgi:hypothetical protein